MRNSLLLTVALVAGLTMAGCGSKPDGTAAEQKVAETEKQLAQARTTAGAEQKVAELEKQLQEAKQELAAAKNAPAPAAPEPVAPKEPPPPPKPKEYVIPEGTAIPVRTTNALSTKTVQSGAPFSASLTQPLIVEGEEIAPAGAEVSGVVSLSDPGGRVKGKASISVTLKSIQTKYGPVQVQTGSHSAVAKSTVKKDVVRGGIMSGAGAAIGAIAGGGKGAAIGAGIGGAAGVGTAMATRGEAAVIAAESPLRFTLKAPVTITVQQ